MSAAARRTNKRLYRWSALIGGVAVVSLCIVLWRSHSRPVAPTSATRTNTTNTPVVIPTPKVDAGLLQLVGAWSQQQKVQTAVYVQEMSGELRTASNNPTTSVVPASMYKIYVAYAVLAGIEKGQYNLNTKTTDGNTIQVDLKTMIVDSNNTAARTLGFMVGWKNINALLTEQGLTGTDLYNYVPPSTDPVGDKSTTVNDLGLILSKLYKNELLNEEHTQLLIGFMKQQHYRERIPAGVPATVVVADKPGWLSPADGVSQYIQNDAAIVYGPKSTYVLVIATNGSSTKPLARLSTQIYNYLQM